MPRKQLPSGSPNDAPTCRWLLPFARVACNKNTRLENNALKSAFKTYRRGCIRLLLHEFSLKILEQQPSMRIQSSLS
ncbi:unnamed protein product [Sphagnum balticum]